MTKFEYTVVDFITPSCTDMDSKLNKLGKEGWELVSVCPRDIDESGLSLISAFLKREIPSK